MTGTITKNTKIFITGHWGTVGAAIWHALKAAGYTNLIGQTIKQLDLKNQNRVHAFFKEVRPHVVIHTELQTAFGLQANPDPYRSVMTELQIQNNLIDAAHTCDVKKFISVVNAPTSVLAAHTPINNTSLLPDDIAFNTTWQAVPKMAGIHTCKAIWRHHGKDFISLLCTNLYGVQDGCTDYEDHVLPLMLRKMHQAVRHNETHVTLTEAATTKRLYVHIDDVAQAVVFALNRRLPKPSYILGSGQPITLQMLAHMSQELTGYRGTVLWEQEAQDTPVPTLADLPSMGALGWQAKYALKTGMTQTYNWFLKYEERFQDLAV